MANVFEQAKRKAREADILDVARRHGVLSRLKKVGDEYVGPCPSCGRQGSLRNQSAQGRQERKAGPVRVPPMRGRRRRHRSRTISQRDEISGRGQGSERRANRRGGSRRSGAAGAQVGVLPRGHRGDGVRPAGPFWARRARSICATSAPSTPVFRRSGGRWRPSPPSAGIRRSTSRKRTPTSLSMSCTGGVSAASSG